MSIRYAIAAGIITTAGLTSGAAQAEPAPAVQTTLQSCLDATNGGDLAMKDCYVAYANAEDARLNAAWARLMKAVGGPRGKLGAALLAEQRPWVRFKETSCRHYTTVSGTAGRLQSQTCYADTISRRADEIEQFAAFYEDTL